jgi:putative transposase
MHRPQRRSIRLRGYDYTRGGAYYITICAHDRSHVLGRIADAMVQLSDLGDIVDECWHAIPTHFPHAAIDAFVIMPNHVHGVITIGDPGDASARGVTVGARDLAPTDDAAPVAHTPPMPATDYDAIMVASTADDARGPHRPRIIPGSLGAIVQGFKAGVTRQARKRDIAVPSTIWQRNYYEHIVRDAADHDRIGQYIAENPANWERDRFR